MSSLRPRSVAPLARARHALKFTRLFCGAEWQECLYTVRHELGTNGKAVTRRHPETFLTAPAGATSVRAVGVAQRKSPEQSMDTKVLTGRNSPSTEGKRPKQLELNFEQHADPDPHQPPNDVEAVRAATHQLEDNQT